MKRILRKVAGVLVATAMVAAMGVSALATDLPASGTVGDNDPAAPLDATLVIQKELTVYNPTAPQVYAPNISYAYAIAAGDSGKEIKDAQGTMAQTKPGPTGASITSSISWASTELVDADADGASNTKALTIDLSGVTFTGAGVYRYVITETCTDKAAAGVTYGDIAETRYLDVYVRDPKTGETGYQIYGYVLFENNNDIDGTDPDSVADAVKTEGFVQEDDPSNPGTPLKADSYYTYNVTVTKELVNDQANAANAFPFEFVFTKASGVTGSFNLVASSSTSPVEMAASVTTSLADGQSITYTGIPCGTTVDIIETNNVATAAYQVTTTGADANISDKLVNYNETTGDTDVEINTTTSGEKATADFDVTFTNTFALISPTGVALAVLPFVILFTFGVGFLVAGTAKKKEDEA